MMNDFWVDDRPPKIKDIDALRDRLQDMVASNLKRYADKDPKHYTDASDGAPYRFDLEDITREEWETVGRDTESLVAQLEAVFENPPTETLRRKETLDALAKYVGEKTLGLNVRMVGTIASWMRQDGLADPVDEPYPARVMIVKSWAQKKGLL